MTALPEIEAEGAHSLEAFLTIARLVYGFDLGTILFADLSGPVKLSDVVSQ